MCEVRRLLHGGRKVGVVQHGGIGAHDLRHGERLPVEHAYRAVEDAQGDGQPRRSHRIVRVRYGRAADRHMHHAIAIHGQESTHIMVVIDQVAGIAHGIHRCHVEQVAQIRVARIHVHRGRCRPACLRRDRRALHRGDQLLRAFGLAIVIIRHHGEPHRGDLIGRAEVAEHAQEHRREQDRKAEQPEQRRFFTQIDAQCGQECAPHRFLSLRKPSP